MNEESGWCMFLGWLLFAIFMGSVATLVILTVRRIAGRGDSEENYLALDITKQRYARGEISREEFKQIEKDLS